MDVHVMRNCLKRRICEHFFPNWSFRANGYINYIYLELNANRWITMLIFVEQLFGFRFQNCKQIICLGITSIFSLTVPHNYLIRIFFNSLLQFFYIHLYALPLFVTICSSALSRAAVTIRHKKKHQSYARIRGSSYFRSLSVSRPLIHPFSLSLSLSGR